MWSFREAGVGTRGGESELREGVEGDEEVVRRERGRKRTRMRG